MLTVYISSLRPCRYAARISAVEAVRYVGNDNDVTIKVKRSRRITPYTMAIGNLRRGRRKAFLVIVSLSLGMILLNTTYTAVTGFDLETYINMYAVADFCVSDYTILNAALPGIHNLNGISAELMQEIESRPGLEDSVYIYARSITQQIPDEVIERVLQQRISDQIVRSVEDSVNTLVQYRTTDAIAYGIDDLALNLVTVTKGGVDKELWESGKGVIIDDFYYHGTGPESDSPLYQVGDDIILTDLNGVGHTYQVMAAGSIEGDASTHYLLDLGLTIILPLESYREIYGETQPMTAVFNVADAQREATEEWLEDYSVNMEKNLDYISYRTYEEEFQESKATYTMIGNVLGAILALMGLLNFINVTVTSMLARQKEMAVLVPLAFYRKMNRKSIVERLRT